MCSPRQGPAPPAHAWSAALGRGLRRLPTHGVQPRPAALTAGGAADNQVKIASAGGIECILAAMDTFKNISAVVEYGCLFLGRGMPTRFHHSTCRLDSTIPPEDARMRCW